MRRAASFVFSVLLCGAPFANAEQRIVSAGGALTETIYALEMESRLVGTDTSSVYPEEATRLPQIGYARALSAEGILSLRPTLLICSEESGPPSVISMVRDAGVEVLVLPSKADIETATARIRSIAEVLGVQERADALVSRLESELQRATAGQIAKKPRVLFLYARSGGVLNVAGENTHAENMILLAGGVNAVEGFEGYKPLTPEAALLANPDVLLLTTRGLEDAGGWDALLGYPGIDQTPAAKNRHVVAMDDLLLLGFGPRLGKAVEELSRLLHSPPSSSKITARSR